jgi:hypothetical protein
LDIFALAFQGLLLLAVAPVAGQESTSGVNACGRVNRVGVR